MARVDVYAVREAPVLWHNLLATLQGRPLRRFRPQRRFLLILNLGDGTGLLTWGPFSWHSRPAFWLKDRIDRAFLRASEAAGIVHPEGRKRPGRGGAYAPPLPQIRTCPIKAYGSSSHGFADPTVH
ncbi:MAG TPA: hypothetical protein VG013_43875 [Gemmataceae bacterium]|nr:hypothetical protein [Gemmataceae bacterium]